MAIFICGQIRATHRRERDRTRVFSWRRVENKEKVWRESKETNCENCGISRHKTKGLVESLMKLRQSLCWKCEKQELSPKFSENDERKLTENFEKNLSKIAFTLISRAFN